MGDLLQLAGELLELRKNVVSKLEKAQKDTAEVICADVKHLAPRDTGEYAESIKVSDTKTTASNIETEVYTDCTVTSKGSGQSYNLGYLLENGYAPHYIFPVDAKALRFEVGGEVVFAKKVFHPGFSGHPHFEVALNDNKTTYYENIGKALDEAFSEVFR